MHPARPTEWNFEDGPLKTKGGRHGEVAAPASSAEALAGLRAAYRALRCATDRCARAVTALPPSKKTEKNLIGRYFTQVTGVAARGWREVWRGTGHGGADPRCVASRGAAGGDDSVAGRTRPPKGSWSYWKRVTQPRLGGAAAHPLPTRRWTFARPRHASPRGPRAPLQQQPAFRGR